MKNLGIIGFGNMGEAMIAGVKSRDPGVNIRFIEKFEPRRQIALQKYGAEDFGNKPAELFSSCEAVILAIKPQDISSLADQYREYSKGASLISIAAGVSISRLESLFGAARIARFMPSLAASVGKSVTGVSYSDGCDEDFKNLAFEVAESIGLAMEMPERLIPAIIGISGSGIAFVYEFINAMALGGVKEGIKYDSSLEVALDVLEGAVATIRNSGITPGELITRVCSPGGTTIEGISSLHANRFTASVMEAISVTTRKAQDLEG